MMLLGSDAIDTALSRLGELLAAAGERLDLVVIGGAAMNLLGVIERATSDVDVPGMVVSAHEDRDAELRGVPRPWSAAVQRAIRDVARDLRLDESWLSTEFRLEWRAALPVGLLERVEWRRFGSLGVGVVARPDLICFKLYAAVDRDPVSVDARARPGKDIRDLLALAPTRGELDAAIAWTLEQDAGVDFPKLVERVADHVRAHTP